MDPREGTSGKLRNLLPFLAVLLLALLLRGQGLLWDGGHHLHPDERFLLMVAGDMETPGSLGEYLDPARSPMNPVNIGHPAFVYGTLPLNVLYFAGALTGRSGYDKLLLPGRLLSLGADLLALGLLGILALLLLPGSAERKRGGALFAMLIYAVAPLPIQLSHFFAADTFQNAFAWGALVLVLLSRKFPKAALPGIFFGGLFMGFAGACKITGGALLPLLVLFLLLPANSLSFGRRFEEAGLFLLLAYAGMRLGSPFYFASSSFLDLRISPVFLEHFRDMLRCHSGKAWFPPSLQWHGTSFGHPAEQLLRYGLGLPLGLFSLGGMLLLGKAWMGELRKKGCSLFPASGPLLLLWGIALFTYHSLEFTKYMRYFLFAYPLLALGGGYALALLEERLRGLWGKLALGALLLLFFLWPAAFVNIYAREHSRVAASRWLLETIPPGAKITYEIWDDPLPLGISGMPWKNPKILGLPIFDNDRSPSKWRKMRENLAQADYLVLSSGRGYESVARVPEQYPRMNRFYEKLFAGELSFRKVRTFTSFPRLVLGPWSLEFDDSSAEESFRVYDHPVVHIFEKTGPLSENLY
ncbi:MAG TPA: hypothetical protein PLA80_07755 [Synergistaceae bacterium]|nr:hypothetical protein [Synergistaceae bacterium]